MSDCLSITSVNILLSVLYNRLSVHYLINVVLFAHAVEERVHVVEHSHHLHGRDQGADGGEPHHVAEQNRHVLKCLPGNAVNTCSVLQVTETCYPKRYLWGLGRSQDGVGESVR